VNEKLNIVIIFAGDFPIGGAYSNRMHGFAKGFIELGHTVHFLIIYPGHKKFDENHLEGEYDKVKYLNLSRESIIPDKIVKKIKTLIIGIKNLLQYLKTENNKNKIDVVISGMDLFLPSFLLSFFCKKHKIQFYREYNEYPMQELEYKRKIPIITEIHYKIFFNLFDGLLLISKPLVKYFKGNILYSHKKIFIIPILVDQNRFNNSELDKVKKNIVFIGDIYGTKDGTNILVEAFKKVHSNIPDQKLILIGDISNNVLFNQFKIRYLNDEIKDKVVFTGFIHKEKVSSFLNEARVLALARPANKQAEAGFPTKLGEYLATGSPVICTKVGDIPDYLFDKVNAFMAEPGSIDSFAEKILFVYQNPEFSKKVGLEGKKLVYKEFNYLYQSEKLIAFFKENKKY